jgi:predicted transcriptional regulator
MTATASWISRKPDCCGGDACVRDTRIPVWTLVEAARRGASAEFVLEGYSQYEIAVRMGISRSTVQRLLAGAAGGSPEAARSLSVMQEQYSSTEEV